MNYLIFAMKRSGHHALINWIAQQSNNTVIHKNNCIHGWENKEFKPMVKRKQVFDKNTKSIDYIVNIEDFDITDFKKYDFKSFNFVKNSKVIIFVRDPYNWIASCYKRKWEKGDYRDVYFGLNRYYINDRKEKKPSRIILWKRQIMECLGYSQYINTHYIDINYNMWFSNKKYRKQIAEKLELNFTDKGINDVVNFGKGSSFDGIGKNAKDMQVFDRWKQFKNDSEYRSFFDYDLIKLARKYFNLENLL